MKRNSLRTRVTTFYVGMLAVALLVFSVAVYFGIRAFLTQDLLNETLEQQRTNHRQRLYFRATRPER